MLPCRHHMPRLSEQQSQHRYPQHAATAFARHRHVARRRLARLQVCSVWDDSLTLADLRQKLDAAVADEDYALAANLRDTLQQRQTDAKLGIEDANAKFYDAFRSGNMKEMPRVWGQGDHVQVVHPGAACIAGRDLVLESWASILRGIRPGAFKIELEDVRVFALSETQGLVTCVEVMDADDSRGRTIATNLFELQNGKWVMVLHHGSPLIRFR
eukprot:GHUV01010440.1.p1 GENE.GHUV01010440.1~~GHUV01010440.1.p1  ORF type:complete len:214 (+),score=29.90 GHUV01010440.1:172-813(+)